MATIVALGVASFLFFALLYPYHFYLREQNNLFLASGEFVRQMFSQGVFAPRLLLPMVAGAYLTQFYHYVAIGPAIVSAVLVLMGVAAWCSLRRLGADWRVSLGVAVVVMLWEGGRQCADSYPLASSLSLLFGLLLAWAYPLRGGAVARGVALGFIILLGVSSIGYGGIVALAYVAVAEAVKRRWTVMALSLVAMAFVPWQGVGRGCVWFAVPDLVVEEYLRIAVKGSWGKSLEDEEPSVGVTNSKVASALLTFDAINRLRDKALDSLDWKAVTLFPSVDETGSSHQFSAAGDIWFHLGDMTMAEHATMLGMIFSPQHSGPRHLCRMTEIALARRDTSAAAKYLKMLAHTVPYAQWAKSHTPGQMNAATEARFAALRCLMPSADTLRMSADYRTSLINLLEANPSNALARTYLLAIDMQRKRMADFLDDYLRFGQGVMTRAYAEALMVVSATAPAGERERLRDIEMPRQVIIDFEAFNRAMAQRDAATLRQKFSHSYWLYCQTK